MDDIYKVIWTNRSLKNAINIKNYLSGKFSLKEVTNFEVLLKEFETTVAHFPTLYPESTIKNRIRRAVIHKNTTIYYTFSDAVVTVIAMKDNRQRKPSL